MSDVGKVIETIVVEPLESPVSSPEPPEPVREPEPVGV